MSMDVRARDMCLVVYNISTNNDKYFTECNSTCVHDSIGCEEGNSLWVYIILFGQL